MAKKFNGKTYPELIPQISNQYKRDAILPKAIPCLTRPVVLTSLNQGELPETDLITGVTALRNSTGYKPSGRKLAAVVIDTGVFEHIYLQGQILERLSANGDEDDVEDYYGHGTHMAGIIAAQRLIISGAGIAPDSKIISIKVSRKKGGDASWASIHRALQMVIDRLESPVFADKHKVKISVVNLSFNGLDSIINDKYFSKQGLSKLIKKLAAYNVPVVISSGNMFENRSISGLGYPACGDVAIHAGSTINYQFPDMNSESLATYSQRILSPFRQNTSDTLVRNMEDNFIQAPGAASISLWISNDAGKQLSVLSGTSVSAAVITACILLLQDAAHKKISRELTVSEIRKILISGSQVITNSHPVQVAGAVVRQVQDEYFDSRKYCQVNIHKSMQFLPNQ